MTSRNIGAAAYAVRPNGQDSMAQPMPRNGSGVYTILHHVLMTLGVAAITALCLMFVRPHLADKLKEMSPFAIDVTPAEPAAVDTSENIAELMKTPIGTAEHVAAPADSINLQTGKGNSNTATREQQWVTSWISRKYHVANDASHMLVTAAYATADDIKLDPLLILAVMAIESGFNPFAESPMGAQGLMQVMSKVHQDKFKQVGGLKAALNPVANIRVGSLILKDYVTRGGSIQAGLKLYVGAGAFDNDAGYGARVIAEYNRLKEVANGHNVPTMTAQAAPVTAKPRTDSTTESGSKAGEINDTKTEPQSAPLASL